MNPRQLETSPNPSSAKEGFIEKHRIYEDVVVIIENQAWVVDRAFPGTGMIIVVLLDSSGSRNRDCRPKRILATRVMAVARQGQWVETGTTALDSEPPFTTVGVARNQFNLRARNVPTREEATEGRV